GLFELLCAARTRSGEETLARWLLSPATAAEIRERQTCVSDLRGRLDLRDDLDAAGDIGVGIHPEALLAWAESANRLQGGWIRVAAIVLPILAIAAAIIWGSLGVSCTLLIVLLAQVAVVYLLSKRLDGIVHAAERGFEDLRLLSTLLARIERGRVDAPAMLVLQEQ